MYVYMYVYIYIYIYIYICVCVCVCVCVCMCAYVYPHIYIIQSRVARSQAPYVPPTCAYDFWKRLHYRTLYTSFTPENKELKVVCNANLLGR